MKRFDLRRLAIPFIRIAWCFILTILCHSKTTAVGERPNILFIAVDDLRPELGCYGASHIISPNIDALAASGRLFERAYCQQAVCNPSRTSLMTGMRPDSVGVTSNHIHFRSLHPDVVTLPQYFKQQGYHAMAIGKIYHGVFPDGASKTKWDTMGDPQSWSVPAIRFGPRYYYTEEGIEAAKQVFQRIYKPKRPVADDWTQKLVFGPATESPDVPDNTLYDGKVADAAIQALHERQQDDKPFFLAVGFIKPHSPYIAPKKYFDLYQDVELAAQTSFPVNAPAFAGHGSGELRRYTDQPNQGVIPEEKRRRVRHAYFACVSFIDAQIGRVLNALEQLGLNDNTIVVLYGDHGYHLGEQGLWGKTTNFELDTRVPLIIRAPGMKDGGKSTASLVELVDLYPTLAELAGLSLSDQLEGKSFARILSDADHETKTEAFSQYPRGGDLMGYSMRTESHRLTQWVHRSSGEIRASELYDYSDGLVEKQNIAAAPPPEFSQLKMRLDAHIESLRGEDLTEVQVNHPGVESFEQVKAGSFDRLESKVGIWIPGEGKSIVDNQHAKTGKQCLQLKGGPKTSLILDLPKDSVIPCDLVFWVERWTRREPFSFRIEKHSENGWEEIFNGDQQVRVGRSFLSQVTVSLDDPDTKQLRFAVTSPPDTGVLIDDVRLVPARLQQILGIKNIPLTLPALIGVDASPLMKLKIETVGSLNPVRLTELALQLDAEDGDVESVMAYFGGNEDRFTAGTSLGQPIDFTKTKDSKLLFSCDQSLVDGDNYVWIACKLSVHANIDHRVGSTITHIKTTDGEIKLNPQSQSSQRLGVAVRNGGDDGVHTYRIPGMATSNQGTLIGVYDIRRRSGGDLPGDIDVGMSRSKDGGRTWEPMKKIMDMGDDPNWRFDGIGDPAVLVDRKTGTIWVAATWSHGNRSWVGSGPGLRPEETGQLMLVRSDDDGVTWSKPINITHQVKRPEWSFILQGPGKGITMQDGTIVFAAQYQDPPNPNDKQAHRLPHSTIIYSKDHGETWQVGTGAFDDTTEAQVVEIKPGVLMLNCRYNRGSVRVVMTTDDMGKTWKRHSSSERALIEPRSCMASLIHVDREVEKNLGGWLLFSNPDSTSGRHHITIKASSDLGLTWPKEFRLLLDEGQGSGYSCMSMIDEHTVGILYEGSQSHLTFQRIRLEDIVGTSRSVSEEDVRSGLSPKESYLKLPRVFGDHMVLQADASIPVWGKAKPDSNVIVRLGHDTLTTKTNQKGDWMVRFSPRAATSVATSLSVRSDDHQIELTDILIGEVWVCAGQSNMEWTLAQSANGEQELLSADDPSIRLLHLAAGARGSGGSYTQQHLQRLTPETFCEGQWQVASAATARPFSAVAWYFGQCLKRELQVPIGLICPAVGGTPTEAWIPQEALEADPDLKGLVAGNWLDNEQLGMFCRTRGLDNLLQAVQDGETIPGDELGPNHSFKPGFMWNAAIKPLIPYGIRGVIWYQGESNAETPERVRQHDSLLPLLIDQWRSHWGLGDFPFIFTQLPALNRPEWPWFRDGQFRMLRKVQNAGMAVTLDTGHPTNVHPTLKKPVGERLAHWALGKTYQMENKIQSGPLFEQIERNGNALVISFLHAGRGLKSSDGKPLRHFEICGNDGIFYPAIAEIKEEGNLVVSSLDVSEPVHVRYAWLPYPEPPINLCNSADLPASPFTSETREEVSARRTERKDTQRPNILFIVSEDNSEHLGCYGERRVHTPHLDALAAGGVRYTRAYVPYSVCSPSRAAFLTGLYTRQTGHIGLATHRFSMYRDFKTMPAYFQQAGYYTGFLGKTHINPERLVEDFVDYRAIRSSNFNKAIGIKTYAEEARTVMQHAAERNRPFMLIINYADAHRSFIGKSKHGYPTRQVEEEIEPYSWIGSDSPHLRDELKQYLNCMNRLDEGIGMVLKHLEEIGERDNTLVIYISDHGADFPRGKGSIYENGTRIPMIIHDPNRFSQGKVETGMVSTIDLLPTMLRAARLPVPDHLPGIALQDVDSGLLPSRHYIHTFTGGSSPNLLYMQFGIRDERYKLVYSPDRALNLLAASRYRNSKLPEPQHVQGFLYPPEYELFDLQEDPDEWTNLADNAEHRPIRERLLRAMKDFQREIKDPFYHQTNIETFLAEQKEYLHKPYKKAGFRWPHLEMFRQAQEVED